MILVGLPEVSGPIPSTHNITSCSGEQILSSDLSEHQIHVVHRQT